MRRLHGSWLAALCMGLGAAQLQGAEPKFEVQLQKAWIQKYQDRTSITAQMRVRHSHQQPNKVGEKSEDGDLHFSGESGDVGLPFVAEVVNAASQTAAVNFIKQTAKHNEQEGSGAGMTVVPVVGAWRLWFEHPSASQVQMGQNNFSPDNTNPDHSFEIHPISNVGAIDVHASMVPVRDASVHPPRDYKAYPASLVFPYFNGLSVTIKASGTAVAIRSQKLKYNYSEFVIELTKKPKKVQDGYIALARVENAEDEEADYGEVRMIFVDGTQGANAMAGAAIGARFHVLGIPRLNLNAVSHLVGQNGTQQFQAKLPYEMIVVGIYPQ